MVCRYYLVTIVLTSDLLSCSFRGVASFNWTVKVVTIEGSVDVNSCVLVCSVISH